MGFQQMGFPARTGQALPSLLPNRASLRPGQQQKQHQQQQPQQQHLVNGVLTNGVIGMSFPAHMFWVAGNKILRCRETIPALLESLILRCRKTKSCIADKAKF